jgi:hypothetical protein
MYWQLKGERKKKTRVFISRFAISTIHYGGISHHPFQTMTATGLTGSAERRAVGSSSDLNDEKLSNIKPSTQQSIK